MNNVILFTENFQPCLPEDGFGSNTKLVPILSCYSKAQDFNVAQIYEYYEDWEMRGYEVFDIPSEKTHAKLYTSLEGAKESVIRDYEMLYWATRGHTHV